MKRLLMVAFLVGVLSNMAFSIDYSPYIDGSQDDKGRNLWHIAAYNCAQKDVFNVFEIQDIINNRVLVKGDIKFVPSLTKRDNSGHTPLEVVQHEVVSIAMKEGSINNMHGAILSDCTQLMIIFLALEEERKFVKSIKK